MPGATRRGRDPVYRVRSIGAVALLLVGGSGRFLVDRGGEDPPRLPEACESTQRVSLATEQAMADALGGKPVDAASCIQLEITVEPSARTAGRAAAGELPQLLWIPDSIRRVPATPNGDSMVIYARSLASSPAAMVGEDPRRTPACNTALLDYPLMASRDAVENNDAVRAAAHEITEWLQTEEGRDALSAAHLGAARPGGC